MNAKKQTQVKSPTMQLIDVCHRQNELIFATRKRLFNLEHNFRLCLVFTAIVLSTTALMGLVVING